MWEKKPPWRSVLSQLDWLLKHFQKILGLYQPTLWDQNWPCNHHNRGTNSLYCNRDCATRVGCQPAITGIQWPFPCPTLGFPQTANCNSVLVITMDAVLVGWAAWKTSNPALGAEETQFQLCYSISPCSAFLCPPTPKNPNGILPPAPKLLFQIPRPLLHSCCLHLSLPHIRFEALHHPSPLTPMPPHNPSFPIGKELTLLFFLFFFFNISPLSRAELRPETIAETHRAIIKNKLSFTYRKSATSDCFHFVPGQSHKLSYIPRAKIFTV